MIKDRQILRINVSDLASISGFNSYKNINELIEIYLYQDLQDLLLQDCQLLDIQLLPIENIINNTIQLIPKKSDRKVLQQIYDIGLHDQILSSNKVSNYRQEIEIVLQKYEEIIDIESMKLLKKELSSSICTNYGKSCEDFVLNKYEEVTGYKISQRNTSLRILQVSYDGTYEVLPYRSFLRFDNITDKNRLANKRRYEQYCIYWEALFEDIYQEYRESNEWSSESASILADCLDLVKVSLDVTICDNVMNLIIPIHLYEDVDIMTILELMSRRFHFELKKVDETVYCIKMINLQSLIHASTRFFILSFIELDSKLIVELKTPCSHRHDSIPLFYIIGRVDGISTQLDTSSDDYKEWKPMQVIIECKNRVKCIPKCPPLYDQIQLVTYMIMYNVSYGDLVQSISDANHHMSNTSITSKDTNEMEIYRVNRYDQLYQHDKHWHEVILSRIYQFHEFISLLRHEDHLRYQYLTLPSEEEKMRLIKQYLNYL